LRVKDSIKKRDLLSLLDNNMSLIQCFNLLSRIIHTVSYQRNRNHLLTADRLIDYLWRSDLLGGHIKPAMIATTKKHLLKTVFSPERIMKLPDMNGGQLSFQGITLLRQLEKNNGEKNVKNTILPSSSTIKRVGYIVDELANKIVPFDVGVLADGSETITFNPEHVLSLMYKAYK
jgi:hypothetical protein